jgi:PmbA protein
LERLLAKAKKIAEQAEVFWVSSQETPVHFEANRLKQVQSKENTSVALRIIKGGKIGFAAASGLDDMEALIDMAVETSQFGLPVKFQFPSLSHYPQVDVFDPEIEKMMAEKMIELGEELIAKVREYAPEILCDVEVTKGISSTHIINSQGGEASYDKSFFSLGLEGILAQDTDMLFVGDDESSCHSPSGIDILADRVIRQLELAKNKAVVSTRLLPVIFTPHGVAGALLTPIALAFNGKTVLEGVSPLKNKLGRQAFDKKLNLCDDATITYGIGSRPCDDEGMPSQRVSLIGSGVVSNFLYDLQTAALAGTESTGNGERAGGGLQIKPAISSLIIDEGNSSLQAMLEDMKEGLIVEQLIGGGQGDVLSGDFSGNVLLGYKVENGEIVGRVKDTMISGNVYQALKEPVGVGNEARWVNGILRSPYLYCPRISVTAKGR